MSSAKQRRRYDHNYTVATGPRSPTVHKFSINFCSAPVNIVVSYCACPTPRRAALMAQSRASRPIDAIYHCLLVAIASCSPVLLLVYEYRYEHTVWTEVSLYVSGGTFSRCIASSPVDWWGASTVSVQTFRINGSVVVWFELNICILTPEHNFSLSTGLSN